MDDVTGKFCYSIDPDGADYNGEFATEEEAHEEARKSFTDTYFIGECEDVVDMLRSTDIAEQLMESVNERLDNEVCMEDGWPLSLGDWKMAALGNLIIDFLRANAVRNTYCVKNSKKYYKENMQ